MKMKFLDDSSATEAQVDMIPLIDVVFLVLVAFIYASMFTTPKMGLVVDLPGASEAITQVSKVLTLTITKDGELFLDKDLILLESLGDTLSVAQTFSNHGVNLFVLADKAAPLSLLVQVMNLSHKSGVKGLTIATEKSTK